MADRLRVDDGGAVKGRAVAAPLVSRSFARFRFPPTSRALAVDERNSPAEEALRTITARYGRPFRSPVEPPAQVATGTRRILATVASD